MTKRTSFTAKGVKEGLRRSSRARRERLGEQAKAQRPGRSARNDLAPHLELVSRTVRSLKSAARRVRKLEAAHVTEVRNAIAEFGFCAPILIDGNDEIIDGHIRCLGAVAAGLEAIPCIVVDHLSSEEVRALRIALNRLGERGTWDIEALKLEFAELIDLDAPVDVTGFSPPEIDQLVLDEDPAAEEIGEVEPDPDLPAVCRPGDVWALGGHRIACADARDPAAYADLLDEGEAATLVLTDPPYNVAIVGHVTGQPHREFAMASGELSREEFEAFNLAWMSLVMLYLADGGLLATFIDWRSIELILAVGRGVGLTLINLIVWAKTNAGMGSLWRSQHELLPVFKNGTAAHRNNVELGRYGRWRSNLWTHPGASTLGSDAREGLKDHPTVKPVALLEDALLDVTDRGDIVIDPFAGSGSTLIAAEKTDRVCRAIEIDPLYVDVAIRRWMLLTDEEPVLLSRRGWSWEEAPIGDAILLPAPPVRMLALDAGAQEA